MSTLKWDEVGTRTFETGTDKGVLFTMKDDGSYNKGVAWSGLTAVTENPSGAESNKQYADNIAYLDLISAEDFGATIEAFTYPAEFAACNGEKEIAAGVVAGQQSRQKFAFAYRTKVGNDIKGADYGYKIHLIWNATAAPSEKGYQTINESPEAMGLSWEISTTPVEVGGDFKPTASITINSATADPTKLKALEDMIYGTTEDDSTIPSPAQVYTMFHAAG